MNLSFSSWRRGFISAGIYLGILIILVPILYLLPDEGFIKLNEAKNQAETETKPQTIINDWYNYLPFVGDLEKQKGLSKNSSHTFKVDAEELAFNGSSNINIQIFVERKDVDDGEIEVDTYSTTQSIETIDFTKLVLPPVISYENGTLSFKSANRQNFDFKYFKPDFTVAQFDNPKMGIENGTSSSFGWNIIYIRVPKSLKIDETPHNVRIQIINQ
ncbi:MAG: hypothetical protein P4L49_13680 [Desulfosporosinus sp.]|nr:hypothetical protein [Desulfosporosinus sp.]